METNKLPGVVNLYAHIGQPVHPSNPGGFSIFLQKGDEMKKIFILGMVCLFMWGCASSTNLKQVYLDENPNLNPEIKELISQGKICLGMTTLQVLASRGRPLDINRTTTASGVDEQWVYVGINPNDKLRLSVKEFNLDQKYAYIYFEDGRVTGWQSR